MNVWQQYVDQMKFAKIRWVNILFYDLSSVFIISSLWFFNNYVQGSFECVCVNGFLRDPENQQCLDIDECNSESSEGLCNDPYECSNTIGSYECVCSAGLVQVTDFEMNFYCFVFWEPKPCDSV